MDGGFFNHELHGCSQIIIECFRMLDAGYWMLDARGGMGDAGFRYQVSGLGEF